MHFISRERNEKYQLPYGFIELLWDLGLFPVWLEDSPDDEMKALAEGLSQLYKNFPCAQILFDRLAAKAMLKDLMEAVVYSKPKRTSMTSFIRTELSSLTPKERFELNVNEIELGFYLGVKAKNILQDMVIDDQKG